MDELVFSTWIPRTHLHLIRIREHLKKGVLPEFVSVKLSESEEMLTIDFEDKQMIVDTEGVFLIKQTLPKEQGLKELNKFSTTASDFFKKFLRTIMPVVYSQVLDGLIPLKENTTLITGSDVKPQRDYEKLSSHGMNIYHTPFNGYETKTTKIIQTKYEISDDYFLLTGFTRSIEYTLAKLMDKVVDLYKRTQEVNKKLEEEELTVEELSDVIKFLADKTKDVSLMHSRLQQIKINLDNKTKKYEHTKHSSIEERMFNIFEIKEILIHSSQDFFYMKELWTMLGDYLDRSLEVLNIVVGRQEALESTRIESLLSFETAQIIATSLIAVLFSTNIINNPKYQGLGTLLIWFLLFLSLTGFFKLKNKRRKKVMKTIYKK